MRKRFRGMELDGEQLSRAEIKRRRECLRIAKLQLTKKSRKLKLAIKNEVSLPDIHARKKRVKLDRTCLGRSSKKCGRCEAKPRLMRYKGILGKKHLLCPACGWSDRGGYSPWNKPLHTTSGTQYGKGAI